MLDTRFFDASMIRRTINLLKPNGALFEIRIIQKGSKKQVISGYFKDADTLLKALETIRADGSNIYITLNKVNSACYSREQHDCLRQTNVNTQDKEIDRYEWLFIDLDPERLSEISSSKEELADARNTMGKVHDYLKGLGFSEPIAGLSGNGYHLLYRIDLPNAQESKDLIEHCLSNLANMFNGRTKIDIVNFNQSRICKLYGTLAQKGANTTDRPHRMSKLLSEPKELTVNGKELLEKLAGELPKAAPVPKQTKKNAPSSSTTFDLEDWMQEHGLATLGKKEGNGCTIYPLTECPFDHSHTNGDSKIFQYSDGAIAFKCHHNSCRGKKWQDVRELFEPGVYDKETEEEFDRRIEEGWQQHKQYRMMVMTDNTEEIRKNLPKLKAISAIDLQQKKFAEKYYAVDNMIPEGETVIAAPPKTGKSWLMLDMCIKVAKGEQFLGFSTTKSGTLYLALEDGDSFEQERLNKVLDNAPAPPDFHFVFEGVKPMQEGFLLQLEDLLEKFPDVKVVVIDTLNFIKYRANKNANAYEVDYQTGNELKKFGESRHIAIVNVTHTTKMLHPEDSMSDVSGTNGVTGAADSVVVISKETRQSKEAKIFITGRKVRQSEHDIVFNTEKCVWEYIGVSDPSDRSALEKEAKEQEYLNSGIRDVVIRIANTQKGTWRGRAGDLIQTAVDLGVGLEESARDIGGFLCKMQGMFLKIDKVTLKIINNGTGPKIYQIDGIEEEIPFEDLGE